MTKSYLIQVHYDGNINGEELRKEMDEAIAKVKAKYKLKTTNISTYTLYTK